VGDIRTRWPTVRITLRADSGFCRESLMAWCEAHRVDYVFGLAKNNRLLAQVQVELAQAQAQYVQTGQPARVFTEFLYQTLESWTQERRVVAKAEYLEKGANPRFVVTSLSPTRLTAQAVYEERYCARGDMENRIKEQQLDLFADRTSTARLWSNQIRLYWSAFAYVLLQTLRRLGLHGTEMAHAQCGTIRLRLLKIGALLIVSVRRISVALASGYPYVPLFQHVYAQLRC
jgi:Transposase DDE domain group 1